MRVCIIQPSYIPWKGYFHQIAMSDAFIFLDTVQYDKRGWRNRNQIKTPAGSSWLTIPVHAHGSHDGLLIQDVEVQDNAWCLNHLQKLRLNYRKAPFFEKEFGWIEEMLVAASGHRKISQIAIDCTKTIAGKIGIHATRFLVASELPVRADNPNERLLKLAQAVGATTYLSGPSAKSYLDLKLFEEAGTQVEWARYDYPEYEQLHPPFSHQVSILDLILSVGAEQAGNHIWKPVSAGAAE